MVSLQITSSLDIFVACSDGTISYYDAQRKLTSLNRDAQCGEDHGGIVKVQYSEQSQLLVVAFETGIVHMRKCVLGVPSHFTWRESCLSLYSQAREIFDMECLLLRGTETDCPIFEVWLGMDSEQIEVWRIPISPTLVWTNDTVDRIRNISHVNVTNPPIQGERGEENSAVKCVQKSADESVVVSVWCTGKNGAEVSLVSVASKLCLRTISLDKPG